MAYNFSFETDKVIVDGRRLLRVSLTETNVQINSEATITGLPRYGVIVRYKATLTPSAATTIDPAIGRVASFVAETQDEISDNLSAAEHIDNTDLVRYFSAAGELIIRSTPDANGDDIDTWFLIATGWEM